MPQILLTEATIISSLLDSFCLLTVSRVKHLSKFMTNISDIFQSTSKDLYREHRLAQQQLDNDHDQNPSIHHIQMIAFASVFNLAKRLKQASDDVKKLLQRVTITSVKGLYARIDDIREGCSDLIVDVKQNNDRLKQIEKKIELSMKTSPSKTLLRSKSGGLLKFDETRQRTQVLITNKMWLQIQNRYKKLIDEINVLNKSRCQFSRLLFINFVSILGQTISTFNCESLIKEMDEFSYSNKHLLQHIVTSVQNQCGRSQLLRNRVVNAINTRTENDDQIVKNFKDIQSFSELFIIKSKINKKQFQHARNMIMGQAKWGQYFLGCLCSKLYTEISLDKQKYDELATIIKIMFANLAQQKGRANLIYKILYISLRVSINGIHLILQLSKYKDHWENKKRWDELVDFLKIQLDNQNKQKQLQSQQKTLMREKSLNFLLKNNNMYLKASCIDEVQDTGYQALRQINIMIAKLQLDNQFIVKFVIQTCTRLRLSRIQKKKLITYHHKHKKSAIQTYLSKKYTISRRFNQYSTQIKDKLIFCIQKSLQFIPLGQSFVQILLVNKKWYKDLRSSVFRRFLIDEHNVNLLQKIRPMIYTALIPALYSKQIYLKMKSQLPAKSQIFHLIKMDVHRSLNWKSSLKPKLEELLNIFSYYNEKIGYLQGMNYLGEHLLKLNLDSQVTYTIFEYLIVKYFSDMFTSNFDLMRLRFYQFNRLMEVYHPKLFKHFQNQKIQSEHYLVAWVMTLWGEQQGDVVWILWDGFVIDGWKWWMQVGLWILQMNMQQLLQMGFEQILKFLNDDLPGKMLASSFTDLFQFGIEPLKIKDAIKKNKVTDKMLKLIEQQYAYVIKRCGDEMQQSGYF